MISECGGRWSRIVDVMSMCALGGRLSFDVLFGSRPGGPTAVGVVLPAKRTRSVKTKVRRGFVPKIARAPDRGSNDFLMEQGQVAGADAKRGQRTR